MNIIKIELPLGENKGIDKLCSTFSSFLLPFKTKQEGKAELIKIDNEIHIIDKIKAYKDDPVLHYIYEREINKLKNISTALETAMDDLMLDQGEISDKPVDVDWINLFTDSTGNISDNSVLSIFGKILSGEIREPGSFSKKALNILRHLSKEEAKAMIDVKKYLFNDHLFIFQQNLLERINGESYMILVEAGIINDVLVDRSIPMTTEPIELNIGNTVVLFENTKENFAFRAKALTKAGVQLMRIIKSDEPDGDFVSKVIEYLRSKGLTIKTI